MIAILLVIVICFLISPVVGGLSIVGFLSAITIGLIVKEEREKKAKGKTTNKKKK